jgi:hypothetical protein
MGQEPHPAQSAAESLGTGLDSATGRHAKTKFHFLNIFTTKDMQ